MSRIAVIGIGNTLMGDDGLGVRIAEQLADAHPDADARGVDICAGHTAGMGLMPQVMAAEKVVFVDAVDVGDAPGSVFRLDPDSAGLTSLRSNTSHGVGVSYLVTGARLQGHWPEFVVYAVQIGDVMAGPDTLSPGVTAAVADVVTMIAEETGLAGGAHS